MLPRDLIISGKGVVDMVRIAKDTDLNFVKHLWSECFDDTAEFVDWNFSQNYTPQNTLIADFSGIPASALQLIPYDMKLFNSDISCRYVSGVSTLPNYRGKGLVRQLFDFALPYMYRLGCGISVLFPAVNGMYEKFGYRTVGERFEYTTSQLSSGITEISEELFKKLNFIYTREMSDKSFYTNRNRFDWECILTDLIPLSNGRVVFTESGYQLAYPNSGNEHKYIIEEVCGCGRDFLDAKPTYPIMVRVINLHKFLRICAPYIPFNGVYTIKDEFIPQNNISLRLASSNVYPCDEPGTEVDIGELCSEIFKYVPRLYVNLLF